MEDHQRQDDVMIKVLEERVNLWMQSTTEYRKSLCCKLDVVLKEIADIRSRLDRLPCDARKPAWENVMRNIYALWGFVGTIILIIVSEWIKGK